MNSPNEADSKESEVNSNPTVTSVDGKPNEKFLRNFRKYFQPITALISDQFEADVIHLKGDINNERLNELKEIKKEKNNVFVTL